MQRLARARLARLPPDTSPRGGHRRQQCSALSNGLFAEKKSGRNLAVRKPYGDGGAGSRNRLTKLARPFQVCVSLGRLL
jgi:hypothetical protein